MTAKKEKGDMLKILLDINNIKGSHDMALILAKTCCASCTSVLGGEEEAEEEILMTILITICLWLLFLLMHIFMFDSFQLLFDLFIF